MALPTKLLLFMMMSACLSYAMNLNYADFQADNEKLWDQLAHDFHVDENNNDGEEVNVQFGKIKRPEFEKGVVGLNVGSRKIKWPEFGPKNLGPVEDEKSWEDALIENDDMMSDDSTFDQQVEEECVMAHNSFRTSNDFMKSNATLQSLAKELAADKYTSVGSYGKNLFYSDDAFHNISNALSTAIDDWYMEICDLFESRKRCVLKKSLAQMLWKGAKEIGCAIRKSEDGKYSVAVVYSKAPVGDKAKEKSNLPSCRKLLEDKKKKKEECWAKTSNNWMMGGFGFGFK